MLMKAVKGMLRAALQGHLLPDAASLGHSNPLVVRQSPAAAACLDQSFAKGQSWTTAGRLSCTQPSNLLPKPPPFPYKSFCPVAESEPWEDQGFVTWLIKNALSMTLQKSSSRMMVLGPPSNMPSMCINCRQG